MSAPTLTRRALPKLPKRESSAVPRSQLERIWLISGGLIAFLLLVIGYFFFISPQRSSTSDVNNQAATARQQNAVLQARLDALREENKNLGTYQSQLAALQQALPSTSGVSDFVRMLQSLGNATLTDVTSLTVTDPVIAAPVAVAAPTGTPAAGAAAAPAAGAAPAPAAGAPTGTAAGAAAGAAAAPTAGVFSMSITASVTGSATGLTNFLDQLQSVQPRAVLINNVSLAGSGGAGQSGTYTLDLAMKAFVAPTSSVQNPALPASAAAPSAAPSAAPTATASR